MKRKENVFFKPMFDMTSGKFVPQGVLTLNAKRKKDWVDKVFGRKTTKTEKLIVKGTVYGVGALALLGAGGTIARRFGR